MNNILFPFITHHEIIDLHEVNGLREGVKNSVRVRNFFCKIGFIRFFYDKIKIIGGPFIMARQKKPVHRVQIT